MQADSGIERSIRTLREERDDRIADVLIDESAVRPNDRAGSRQIVVEKIERPCGREAFRDAREAANVGEQNRHVALDMVAELHVDDVAPVELAQKFCRDEACKRIVAALDVGDMLFLR